ncbi:MAG: hypothetical protein WC565_09005 [Parcubacteria group bacterium]
MSIRAYLVTNIETNDDPSFNVWHSHEEVKKRFTYLSYENGDGGGYCEIATEDMLKLIADLKAKKFEGMEEEERESLLKNFVQDFRMAPCGFILYQCS